MHFSLSSDAIEFRVFVYNCFQSASNVCMDAVLSSGAAEWPRVIFEIMQWFSSSDAADCRVYV